MVTEEERHLLIVSARWHDLGYTPALRDTGAHQIDGARYLTELRYLAGLCALVAHRSAATCGADSGTAVPEKAYRHDLHAVLDDGAIVMDDLFRSARASHSVRHSAGPEDRRRRATRSQGDGPWARRPARSRW